MNRGAWKFAYTADKLLDAARAKVAHHVSRRQWWQDKKEEVVGKIRAEGIEIDESLSDLTSNSYHRGGTVQVRDDLLRDLQECVSKIHEHREKVEDYSAWCEVLGSQGQTTFDLFQDDWLFFFSKA